MGLLLGSLIITGSSYLLSGYLLSAAPISDHSSYDQQIKGSINQCENNQQIIESVRTWCTDVIPIAYENNIDPYLVAAIIEVESAGNADAYSKSGAVGLMQVMPKDGLASQFQCINGPCFANRPSMNELYDPQYNISYGSHYLAGLISKNDGDIRQALVSYGPADYGTTYADLVLRKYNQFIQ
jgi:hypothetical protein